MKDQIIKTSDIFWEGMMEQNEAKMRSVSDPNCHFVHIGTNADLNKEINYYTKDIFHPTNIDIHNREIHMFGDTAIMLTDVDYGLLLDGKDTTHHFMVTEVYQNQNDDWKLIQFTFTALIH